jgi:anhydro-N-acetylmuramic acid kinase
LADQYFKKPPPKSTGREYFNLAWLENILKNYSSLDPADVQASLCELTAVSCVAAITEQAPSTQEVLVCGGGNHNAYLMARLTAVLSETLPQCQLKTTAADGIDPDWVEAVAFAWMAKQTLENLPSNLPGVTGASHAVILGGVYKS